MSQKRVNFLNTVPFGSLKVGAVDIQPKRFVKLASGLLVIPAASTDILVGVNHTLAKIGTMANIQIFGVAVITSGAAVTLNARVMSDAAGKCIDFVAGAGNAVGGIALNGAAGPDEDVEVLLAGPASFGAT